MRKGLALILSFASLASVLRVDAAFAQVTVPNE